MLVGSKRPLFADGFTTTIPRGVSKFSIIHLLQSSFDRKFTAEKTWTATKLFRRKIIRVEGVIATRSASHRCASSNRVSQSQGLLKLLSTLR
jgi:hypothetical protein